MNSREREVYRKSNEVTGVKWRNETTPNDQPCSLPFAFSFFDWFRTRGSWIYLSCDCFGACGYERMHHHHHSHLLLFCTLLLVLVDRAVQQRCPPEGFDSMSSFNLTAWVEHPWYVTRRPHHFTPAASCNNNKKKKKRKGSIADLWPF